jgi:hypothetical protein
MQPQSLPLVNLHWTSGGTGITNFDPKDWPIYQKAIEEYGDKRLFLSRKGMPPAIWLCSLHDLGGRRNLSDFWKVFDSARQSKGTDNQRGS